MNTVNVRHGREEGHGHVQFAPLWRDIFRNCLNSHARARARGLFIIVRGIYVDIPGGTNVWLRQCLESRRKNRPDKTPRMKRERERERDTCERAKERNTYESAKECASERVYVKKRRRRIGGRVSIRERIDVCVCVYV